MGLVPCVFRRGFDLGNDTPTRRTEYRTLTNREFHMTWFGRLVSIPCVVALMAVVGCGERDTADHSPRPEPVWVVTGVGGPGGSSNEVCLTGAAGPLAMRESHCRKFADPALVADTMKSELLLGTCVTVSPRVADKSIDSIREVECPAREKPDGS